MRTIGGILLGLLLFFPGVELLRWLMVRGLGAYDAMTLTDGCLLMIMILLSVHLVRRPRGAEQKRASRRTQEDSYGDPQLQYLPGTRAKGSSRQTSRTRRTSSRRAH